MPKISISVMQHAFFFCVSNSVKHFFENLNLNKFIKTRTLGIPPVLILSISLCLNNCVKNISQ